MRQDIFAMAMAMAAMCASAIAAHAQTAPPPGAMACSGCHAGGDSAMPTLVGKSASDIEAAMKAFRSGARDATVMDRISKGFTDQEASAIAAWIARTGGGK